MKVAKFGGTSLANAEQLRKVCRLIQADSKRRIIVVSAPGKRYKDDMKVTDMLIAYGQHREEGRNGEELLGLIVDRYANIARDLGLDQSQIVRITDAIEQIRILEPDENLRWRDALKAVGEDTSARLFAELLNNNGVQAAYVNPMDAGLLVEGTCGDARILPGTMDILAKLSNREERLVIPGFFGYTPEGRIVTFSRGGSDITGAIIAAAVGAEVYENFTDVDSVLSVNPSIIPDAAPIRELTYREMRELSYAGFTVYHEEALLPAFRAGIPVWIRNTNNPAAEGTRIVAERPSSDGVVAGIASAGGFCSIYVTKYLMNREIGFGRRLLQILEENRIPYEHTPTGIDNMSIIVRESVLGEGTLERVIQRIKQELDVDDIRVVHRLALIMVVGEGMLSSVGAAARAAQSLAEAGINIQMINQGCSEVSLMFGIREEDEKRAVAHLYEAFFREAKVAISR
ncbi:aspartate kinase [Paenibacillus cellulosilyticus]|uniref:Aspartokinase n=1 Tax=Paenibacillus cellulosilyticus TaxID=375489 RepID=A0A2V2YTU8_9BACL|nr:aspartate kinase [Paenibacillus cellulosilyticus]PWW02864.1 aspartate kinase [Paenibacillus cellulosilyticus]QKS45779.1 aspartate kinase [Paenibacillus cellulosilyticus]